MTKIILDITSCHLAKENALWRDGGTDSVLSQVERWNYYIFTTITSILYSLFLPLIDMNTLHLKCKLRCIPTLHNSWWNSKCVNLCCSWHSSSLIFWIPSHFQCYLKTTLKKVGLLLCFENWKLQVHFWRRIVKKISVGFQTL